MEANIVLHAQTQYTLDARGGRNPKAEIENWNVHFFNGLDLRRWFACGDDFDLMSRFSVGAVMDGLPPRFTAVFNTKGLV